MRPGLHWRGGSVVWLVHHVGGAYDAAMSAIARIIDANANRAREALRVLEDAARFALDDRRLTEDIKTLRHDLRSALDRLPAGWIEASRHTPGDVGTHLSTPGEQIRTSLHDVAVAAGKRLSEALRSMEEAAKMVDADLARAVEAVRYRAYDIEYRVQRRLGCSAARQWRLCVLLTSSHCRLPWHEVLTACIENGAGCVQIREKAMADRALLRHVQDVIELAQPAGVAVIVNDRIDVALAAGADGVHLGEDDLSIAVARRLAGRTLLIGASTHDIDEAARAVDAGADYCGVGAMFASSLKPGRTPAGPAYLRAFVERFSTVPHLAIGGITPDNVRDLVDAGARGVAVSSAVCAADDPAEVVRALRAAVDSASTPVADGAQHVSIEMQ